MTVAPPSPQFCSVRNHTSLTASVLLATELLGSSAQEAIAHFGFAFPDASAATLALAAAVLFFLIRLWIEWRRQPQEVRQDAVNVHDCLVPVVLGSLSLVFFLWRLFQGTAWTDPVCLIGAVAIVLYGAFLGASTAAAIDVARFIRKTDEARRRGLHRLPVAARAVWEGTAITWLTFPIPLVISRWFPQPLAGSWLLFFAAPFLAIIISQIWTSFLSPKLEASGELRRVRLRRQMMQAYDIHDATYQVGGWDHLAAGVDSALYEYAEKGDLEAVRRHIEAGADPDEQGRLGWTPLMIAAAGGHTDVVRFLLSVGADPNVVNLHGRSPLCFAARYGYDRIARALIDHGAHVNLDSEPPVEDESPLIAAARAGHVDLVRLLLQSGADVSQTDSQGMNALDHAHQSGHGEIATILRNALRTRGKNDGDRT